MGRAGSGLQCNANPCDHQSERQGWWHVASLAFANLQGSSIYLFPTQKNNMCAVSWVQLYCIDGVIFLQLPVI